MKIVCYKCRQEGERSTVQMTGQRSTLMGGGMGHYDEEGNYVRGIDPNWKTTGYHCSRGHAFEIIRKEGEPDRLRLGSNYSGSPTSRPSDITLDADGSPLTPVPPSTPSAPATP